jgi:hypothetical protein
MFGTRSNGLSVRIRTKSQENSGYHGAAMSATSRIRRLFALRVHSSRLQFRRNFGTESKHAAITYRPCYNEPEMVRRTSVPGAAAT